MERDLRNLAPKEATDEIKTEAAILFYADDKEVRRRMASLKRKSPQKHAMVRDQLRQLRESQGNAIAPEEKP